MRRSVQALFSQVAERYERINHILTFGLDIAWRRQAAQAASLQRGSLWLDVCSGTGEMAWELFTAVGAEVNIVAADFSLPMLLRGTCRRAQDKIWPTLAEASRLPFPDGTFDLVVISFATRNIDHSKQALVLHFEEFRRVLKTGGVFMNLETSQPRNPLFRKLFHFYVKTAVRPVGSFFSGSPAAYAYLASTIPRFYAPEELSALIRRAGFSHIQYRRLFFGVAAIHTGKK